MMKKLFKLVILCMAAVGLIFGIWFTIKKQLPESSKKEVESKIFSVIQAKTADATVFYTYGRALNLEGKIENVSKDNFENAKLFITDGKKYEKEYTLDYEFEEKTLKFTCDTEMNSGIIIDELEDSEYYILLRLKLNNSIEPRYYSFSNSSKGDTINYYTVTNDGKNKHAVISFNDKKFKDTTYNLLTIKLEEKELPENVYDIVIDAGHGGTDKGENAGGMNEADIVLDYAYLLKDKLESNGYKVKLTRTNENTNSYNYTNMYDSDGRISEACKSKAKLMISFHINQGNQGLRGVEIYSPGNSNLDFAKEMAQKIKANSSIEFSNNNSFKKADGVYVRNFTKAIIRDFENTANKKGYAPYPITTDTPYLYTIRETGGIATGAYVDGRNTSYSANKYYNSNQGIECYQVELGYIKNDLNIITNEKENYINAITEAICNHY